MGDHRYADLISVTFAALRRLAEGMQHAIENWRTSRRRDKAIAALHALDDRLLNDIGLHRSQIYTAVHGLDPDRPRAGDRRGSMTRTQGSTAGGMITESRQPGLTVRVRTVKSAARGSIGASRFGHHGTGPRHAM